MEGLISLESNEFTILGPLSGKYVIEDGLGRAASWVGSIRASDRGLVEAVLATLWAVLAREPWQGSGWAITPTSSLRRVGLAPAMVASSAWPSLKRGENKPWTGPAP